MKKVCELQINGVQNGHSDRQCVTGKQENIISVCKIQENKMCYLQNGAQFYWHISENTQQGNNRVDNFEALYCTLALLCIEMGGDEILIELFRLALGIQVH